MPAIDRGRGVLNQRQREYLLGESDIEEKSPAERAIRQDIRENLRNAIMDFPILLNELEDRDLDRAFHPNTPKRRWSDKVTNSVSSLVGIAYLSDEAVFETKAKQGIAAAERRKGWEVEVHLEFSVDRTDELAQLIEEIDEYGADADLSIDELNTLLAAGEIDRSLYGEMMEDRV